MNPIDLALVVLVLLAALRGATRGFFRESCSFLGLIAAFTAAFAGSERGVELLRNYAALSAPAQVQSGVAFVAIFAAVQSVANSLGYFLERLAAVRGPQVVSRVGGAVVGVMKGMLILAVVVLFIYLFQGTSPIGTKIGSSHLARPMIDAAANAIRSSAMPATGS